MKNHHIHILFVAVLLAVSSCTRKELPEQEIPVPVFKASGTLDGADFSLAAGTNGYVMNSTFSQDEFGLTSYSSTIEQSACTSCGPKISVYLNSSSPEMPGDPSNVSVFFDPQTYPLQMGEFTIDYLTMQFFPMIEDAFLGTVHWDFGDTNSSEEPTPTHTYAVPGVYDVTLTVNNPAQGCFNSITQSINVGAPCGFSDPQVMTTIPISDTQVFITPSFSSMPAVVLSWEVSIDNGPIQTYTDQDILINIPVNSFATVTLIYDDGSGCVSSITEMIPGITYMGCLVNFVSYPLPVSSFDRYCVIEYTDSNGEVYTSSFPSNSDPSNYFEIISSLDYGAEINGHPTRQCNVEFTCYMQNANNPADIKYFENISAVFAFAHP